VDIAKGGQFTCKFLIGTRRETANIRFDIAVKIQGINVPVPLDPVFTRPFIVITSENHFEESLKRLFLQEIFRGKDSLPWPLVANELSVFFLKATRQDLSKPTRGLSEKDFLYLHKTKFGGQPQIPSSVFEKFWDQWFGKVLRELRYKRHLKNMWNLGYIYGFVDKDNVKALLSRTIPGQFLLRFSDRYSGSLAVNTLKPGGVSNYLIKSEETNLKKTHADFLKTKRELTHVLQFMNQYTTDELPVFRPIEKDAAFDSYYSRSTEDQNSGYDDWDDDGGEQQQEEAEDFLSSFVFKSETGFMQ